MGTRRRVVMVTALALALAVGAAAADQQFKAGNPKLQSMSALTFGPDGVLFVGDGKAGAIVALELGDRTARDVTEGLSIQDVEGKIAALLGATPEQIMIHDMAVNPISRNVYLAVSRGRTDWNSRWLLPNDIADASILLRVEADGTIDEVALEKVRHARATLPNPVGTDKTHRWKEGVNLRADTITDLAYADGTLYVAGLSNEEFASTMWRLSYPFGGDASATTLEIFHAAHGEYETHAPIRTFLPYSLNDELHLLAAYLCTPLATFKEADLADGKHLKGRTVGEFGSGNYPLDMIVYRKDGEERLLIANSNLPFMIVEPSKIEAFEGSITTEPEGYVAGVSYEVRSETGVQQIDNLSDSFILALQRLPGGKMDLVSLPVRRF